MNLTDRYIDTVGGGQMTNLLNSLDFLPTTDPWGFDISVPDFSGARSNVVDWIWIEEARAVLDTPSQYNEIVFVKKNGDVVDVDGSSPVTFKDLPGGSVYLVIHHRNHLSIASSAPMTCNHGAQAINYDFTDDSNKAYGLNPTFEVDNGVWALWGGESNYDGKVTAFDFSLGWLPNNGQSPRYHISDFNLDSNFTAFDFIHVWLPANGRTAQIPH